MTTDLSGSDPSGSDPLGLTVQERVVLDLLPADPPGLDDLEMGAKLNILPDSVRARSSALFDQGLAYRAKPPGEARLRYWLVPPPEREQAKEAASGRKKNAVLRSLRNLDPGAQVWTIQEILRPTNSRFDVDQPCPQENGGVCDCPDANVYAQRHERRKREVPRRLARQTAVKLREDWKRREAEIKALRNDNSPLTLYTQDVAYITRFSQIAGHLATRVEDEMEIRRIYGQCQIPDEVFGEWLTRLQEAQGAVDQIAAAVARVRNDDVMDVDAVDDDEERSLVLDVVDAEIVEDDEEA
jgi:hypothetical protein